MADLSNYEHDRRGIQATAPVSASHGTPPGMTTFFGRRKAVSPFQVTNQNDPLCIVSPRAPC